MRRLFNRLAKERPESRTSAICEALESRRLLSASAGVTLHRIKHLSTYDAIDPIVIATVSGPTIAALNTNYTGTGVSLGESVGGQVVANIQVGTSHSAAPLSGRFTTTDAQDTLQISSPGDLRVGMNPLRITLSENGKTLATLNEQVRVLPLPVKGLKLHAIAGQQFSGTVGFLPMPLQPEQKLRIEWGDQTNDLAPPETVTQTNGQIAVDGTHTYAEPGRYLITVYATMHIGGPSGPDEITQEILSRITVSRK